LEVKRKRDSSAQSVPRNDNILGFRIDGIAMTLREIVEKYLAIAGGFAFLAPLADFGLERSDVERIFSALDEDYHISRYFHFSQVSGPAYMIDGFEQTHISIDEEIQSVL
jgi:hypothetical protein